MAADLPGGNKKPRSATPLAWRLVYLAVLSVVGWSFLSTRAASAQIAADVALTHDDLETLLAEVKAVSSGYKTALTAASARPIVEDALEQRLSKVATQISEDMGAHVAKSVAAAVGSVTRTELEASTSGIAASIGAAMRKELLALEAKWEQTLEASLAALKAEQDRSHSQLALSRTR